MAMSDPESIVEALEEAQDAFDNVFHKDSEFENGINDGRDWKAQLTKGCRLLEAARDLEGEYFTATVELSFGVMERSLQAYALKAGGDELEDFDDHTHCYNRASNLGLLSREICEDLRDFYSANRVESYYGGGKPTNHQAESMVILASEIHGHAVSQIRTGGVCNCSAID